MTIAELEQAVRNLPNHEVDGWEWEWTCEHRWDTPRYPRKYPDCKSDAPEHKHELISRDRVLALIEEMKR